MTLIVSGLFALSASTSVKSAVSAFYLLKAEQLPQIFAFPTA